MHIKESSIRPSIDRAVISSAGERRFQTFTDIASSSNMLTETKKNYYRKCMLASDNLNYSTIF